MLNRLLKLTMGEGEENGKGRAKSSENKTEYSRRLLVSATKRDLWTVLEHWLKGTCK